MKKLLLPIGMLILLVTNSCKKEQRFSSFSTNILAPIAKADLSLNDLANDSLLVQDANGALSLVYDYELYNGKVAEFFEIPDTQRMLTLRLDSLKLADQDIFQSVPLYAVYAPAIFLNGQTAAIPAQSIPNLAAIPIDGSEFFNTATFKSGTMELSIDNGYPVELTLMIFKLRNVVDGTLIQQDTFKNILPGTTQTKVIDLAGKTLYAQMEAEVSLLETAASNGNVLINASAMTTIRIQVKNMKPQSAIARFPTQSVISKDEVVIYDFGEAQVKELIIKSGYIRFDIVSTIQEDMVVNYTIPYATKNNQVFKQTFTVPAAPPGGSSTFKGDYDITGYKIDLRGRNPMVDDTVNSFAHVLDVTIDSSGRETAISLDDSIYVYYGLVQMVPEYARGYFGSQTIDLGPESVAFDFFNKIKGNIDLEDITMNLDISNGIGANAELTFDYLDAKNSFNSTTVGLNGTAMNTAHVIPPATVPVYPFIIPSVTSIPFNTGNSNIKPFLESFPDRLDYHAILKTNPGGNPGTYNDFITDNSALVASLGVKMPFSFKSTGLILMDTANFNFGDMERTERITGGYLNIVADNGFPLEADVQVYLLNQNGFLIDSMVVGNSVILPGFIDPATNKVNKPQRSVVKLDLGKEKLQNLRTSKQMIFKVTLKTPQGGNYWKLYQSYNFNVSLTGDFIYEQVF